MEAEATTGWRDIKCGRSTSDASASTRHLKSIYEGEGDAVKGSKAKLVSIKLLVIGNQALAIGCSWKTACEECREKWGGAREQAYTWHLLVPSIVESSVTPGYSLSRGARLSCFFALVL